jgi:hypothetical protein
MKYRKKPIIIEAVKWTGDLNESLIDLVKRGKCEVILSNKNLIIHTLEGEHTANIGDYIIKGVKDELYPCKPDIFEQTYESVEEE